MKIKSISKNLNRHKYKLVSFVSTMVLPGVMFAQATGSGTKDLKGIFGTISDNLAAIPQVIMGVATVAGLGFAVASIFKFKQHKDSPQQVPLGQPIALLGFGVMLIWLPFLLQSLGGTIAGDEAKNTKSGIGEKATPSWITNSN